MIEKIRTAADLIALLQEATVYTVDLRSDPRGIVNEIGLYIKKGNSHDTLYISASEGTLDFSTTDVNWEEN